MAYRTSTTALQLRPMPSSSAVVARPFAVTEEPNTGDRCFYLGHIQAEKQQFRW
jgi:hypothetical protein